ncbi:YicC/YloC family endoribonuclease [Hyphobacterium sp.]|uniref:YicC/YloC family endoribonuclease n=1 Tax=Hyphobacterium sp. TaxID=2004662 RepID=UPI003BA9A55B
MAALSGMTGFARASATHEAWTIGWEIKSVNGKGLEVRFRTPPGYDALELAARDRTKAALHRGSLQASLTVARDAGVAGPSVDHDLIDALIEVAQPYVAAGRAQRPTFDGLLTVRGVLAGDDECSEESRDELEGAILKAFDEALAGLTAARHDEGTALSGMLLTVLDEIAALRTTAVQLAADRPEQMLERFRAKLAELLGRDLPEDRLAQEAAILAVKADIREELDRLEAHLVSARELIEGGSPVGRKLDFLSQEFNREVNTLCSKSGDSELTRIGLALKAAVDQFREQVQNVE